MTHICVGNLTIIGSYNGLSPGRRQAIIWTNDGILLFEPLGTNFNEFFYRNSYNFIQENPFENVVWKMAAILSRPQCDISLVPPVTKPLPAVMMTTFINACMRRNWHDALLAVLVTTTKKAKSCNKSSNNYHMNSHDETSWLVTPLWWWKRP